MQRLEEQLAEANKLIADGTKAIVKLQAEIKRLQREGKDISRARSLLGQYQALQLRLLAEHERLTVLGSKLNKSVEERIAW